VSADRDAFKRAKASGRTEEYWAKNKEAYSRATGGSALKPHGWGAPVSLQQFACARKRGLGRARWSWCIPTQRH